MQRNESTKPESSGSPEEPSEGKRKVTRIPTFRALPSERFGWDAHFPVLKNLVLRSRFGEQPVDTDIVEEGLKTQSASLNMNFFVETGLAIKEKRKYLPTQECIQFVRLYGVDESKARQVLRLVLERAWFARVARHTLELQSSVNEEQLIKELAVDAGVVEVGPKERSFRTLIEYLLYSNLLVREGHMLTLVSLPETTGPTTTLQPSDGRSPSAELSPAGTGVASYATPPQSQLPQGVSRDWIHRNWPGQFELWIRPSQGALRLLQNAMTEIRQSLATEENPSEG